MICKRKMIIIASSDQPREINRLGGARQVAQVQGSTRLDRYYLWATIVCLRGTSSLDGRNPFSTRVSLWTRNVITLAIFDHCCVLLARVSVYIQKH